jgi:hypothetical protein
VTTADQVVVGVTAARMAGDLLPGYAQRGDRSVHLGRRRAGVDQHRSVAAIDEPTGDIEKREPFPDDGHRPSVSGCAARYCSSTCGVGSAV